MPTLCDSCRLAPHNRWPAETCAHCRPDKHPEAYEMLEDLRTMVQIVKGKYGAKGDDRPYDNRPSAGK